ncbi:MAG: FadR family transcriptional regulator [Planctomycetota bacterium]|jgi:GntR family transcriptional repressor for pyruvate dehydrogenase complex|nr:FadR family transcriptional regulator [Planctomycetota bacterium]
MSKRGIQVLSNSIATKMKRKIINGEWRVNEQLPNEQALAGQLLVSRTTIREAVKILVSKNILTIERGKGTFVVNTPGLADDPLGLEFIQEGLLVRHLCECRQALEPYACRLAAERATRRQIDNMRRIIASMVKLEENLAAAKPEGRDDVLDDFANLDAEFHLLLYQMTQNIIFQRLSPIINNTVIENYTTNLYRSRKQKLLFAETHRALFEAIKARNSGLANALAQEHMLIMREELCGKEKNV